MKRRTLLSEMGIAPGNLLHAIGYVRASRPINVGDLLTIVSIGGNGRTVKLLGFMARGGEVLINFRADVYQSLAVRSIA